MKILLSLPIETPTSSEKLDALRASLVEHLGCAAEDILLLPPGVGVQVIDGGVTAPPKPPPAPADGGEETVSAWSPKKKGH